MSRRAAQGRMGWEQTGGTNVIVPNKAKEEWEIREATFLYQTRGLGTQPCYLESQCASNAADSGGPKSRLSSRPSPPTVAIALPDEFMKRVAESGRNLRRSSECEATADGVVNKTTGEKGGCIFTVSDIFWITPTDVEVPGTLRISATDAAIKTYYLKKVGGTWQIVGEHLKSLLCG